MPHHEGDASKIGQVGATAPAVPGLHPFGLAGGVRVLVQPDDGALPVIGLIAAAQQSVSIKQFTFTHPAILQAVIAAHRSGRTVRVMLNPHRSSGDRANDTTESTLREQDIAVSWSNPHFAVTHEKSMLIDDAYALIATFNFCEKYFTVTRDYHACS